MAEEIGNFDAENAIAAFKLRLTNWTLDQYSSMSDILATEKNCLQMRCLRAHADQANFKDFQACVKNCETGVQELIKMQ